MCFDRDPVKRPTAHELLQHSFSIQKDLNEVLLEDESMTSSIAAKSHHIRFLIVTISPSQVSIPFYSISSLIQHQH